jgi:RHS repeat-associated protein
VRHSSGTLPTSFGFTGQRDDGPSVDLMFYNARYLDTRTGRFISADSIVPGAGNPQALNRYSYVLNAPTRYTDPTGRYCLDRSAGALSGQCVEEDGYTETISLKNETPLTQARSRFRGARPYAGAEVHAIFEAMMAETSGWWHSAGTFSVEVFIGLMLLHEAAGSAEILSMIAQATAQQLYVGGNRDPYCPSGTCVSGAFNFLAAYSESVHHLINTYVRGSGSILSYAGYGSFALEGPSRVSQRLTEAARAGDQVLRPANLNPERYSSATDWANFTDVNRAMNKANVVEGTKSDQVVFRTGRGDDSFYMMTALQANYWNGIVGR